jgi:ABC-2 type transport system permease protein
MIDEMQLQQADLEDLHPDHGKRYRMNFLSGFRTLVYKETLRFWKVATQTIAAPILTAMLYLLIFGHVLEGRVTSTRRQLHLVPDSGPGDDERAAERFANSSSSLIQSKITGNLVFVLLTPLSHWEISRPT